MFLCNYATPLQEKKFINFLTKKHIKNASSFFPLINERKKMFKICQPKYKKKTQKKLWITKHFLLDKRHDDDFMNKLCAFLHHIICLRTFIYHETIYPQTNKKNRQINTYYNLTKKTLSFVFTKST